MPEEVVEKKSKVTIPMEPVVDSVVKIDEKPMFLMYVGGAGLTLEYPLSDGRRTLPGHEVFEVKNYTDFVRLTSPSDGLFIECDETGKPKDNNK